LAAMLTSTPIASTSAHVALIKPLPLQSNPRMSSTLAPRLARYIRRQYESGYVVCPSAACGPPEGTPPLGEGARSGPGCPRPEAHPSCYFETLGAPITKSCSTTA
ncbi:MAG: hypothetical protein WBP81_36540, partial [Solirubrobacteraceae bacterium]